MDAIPSSIQNALELFETALADVRFADINAETLARAAAEVHAVATVVASAQASLESARCALKERQDALLAQVQRAVAYARVYAENDEMLAERLNAITLPRAVRTKEDAGLVLSSVPQGSARPRGRPRKASVAEPIPVDPPACRAMTDDAKNVGTGSQRADRSTHESV